MAVYIHGIVLPVSVHIGTVHIEWQIGHILNIHSHISFLLLYHGMLKITTCIFAKSQE